MAQIISRCPLTGHYMFMGLEVEPERFACLPESFARKYCPYCCCEHDWHKREAKLVSSRRPRAHTDLQRVL